MALLYPHYDSNMWLHCITESYIWRSYITILLENHLWKNVNDHLRSKADSSICSMPLKGTSRHKAATFRELFCWTVRWFSTYPCPSRSSPLRIGKHIFLRSLSILQNPGQHHHQQYQHQNKIRKIDLGVLQIFHASVLVIRYHVFSIFFSWWAPYLSRFFHGEHPQTCRVRLPLPRP